MVDVSVVVPCRNEAELIEQCLRSILGFSLEDTEIEVLVVDGHSRDGTRQVVEAVAQQDRRVRLLDNPTRHKPQALNIGIRAARGSWIMRIDAHTIYPPDYLQRCLETARRTGADNVGGIVVAMPRNGSLQATIVQALTTHRFGVGNSQFRLMPDEGHVDTVPFGFFRRELFDRIGLFDERLLHTQDQEYNERIRHHGGTVWLNPKIQSRYYNLGSVWTFLRKTLKDRGPWNPYRWYLAPYSFRLRHAAPIGLVLSLLAATVISLLLPWGWLALVAIAVPYSLLAVLSSLQQALRYRKAVLALILPVMFLLYHLSYGLGGLLGAARLVVGSAPIQRGEHAEGGVS